MASNYDVMNDVMSVGLHRLWKDHLVSYARPAHGNRVLDVAGGTGDVAFRLLAAARKGTVRDYSVTVLDINESMLQVGRDRSQKHRFFGNDLQWVVGDAEALPMPDAHFDLYTIAFGIRNCTHVDRVLSEAHRVLRPGSRFLCLELSPGAFEGRPFLRACYDRYSFEVIPILGQLLAADRRSYQYLVESIRKFPDQKNFSKMIAAVGFERVAHEDLCDGVAVIHSGWKPLAETQSRL